MFLTLKKKPITVHIVNICLLKVIFVYPNPSMEIINPSDNVMDIGICMSSNCSFEFHINNLCKKNVQTCMVGFYECLPPEK